ncbi:MAG: PQQ-binding-like beta-propeller repeat protein [Planctomycetota bacterium]
MARLLAPILLLACSLTLASPSAAVPRDPHLDPAGDEHTVTGGAELLWLTRRATEVPLLELPGVVAAGAGRVFLSATARDLDTAWLEVAAYDELTGAALWEVRRELPVCCDPPYYPSSFASPILDAVLSPDGTRLYVAARRLVDHPVHHNQELTVLWILDAATGAEVAATDYLFADGVRGTLDHLALSADGATLFGCGEYEDELLWRSDIVTAAFDAATGALLWDVVYDADVDADDLPVDLAVDPGGAAVYVTGATDWVSDPDERVTLAYGAADGTLLWSDRFGVDPDPAATDPTDLLVSPDGSQLIVLGVIPSGSEILAYEAATGARQWTGTLAANANFQLGTYLPDGSRVLVAASSFTGVPGGGNDVRVAALDPASGAVLWNRVYASPSPGDGPVGIAVTPDGTAAFVAALSTGAAHTLAVETDDGDLLWSVETSAPGEQLLPTGLALTGGGTRVAVGAHRSLETAAEDSADGVVFALDAAGGAQLWLAELAGISAGREGPRSLALAPGGERVSLASNLQGATGTFVDVAAYDAADGAELWSFRQQVDQEIEELPAHLAYSPGGDVLYGAWPLGSELVVRAFGAADGAEHWTTALPASYGFLEPHELDLDVAADGRIFATRPAADDYRTTILDPVTAAVLGEANYDAAGFDDRPQKLAFSPDGTRFYVTGSSLKEIPLNDGLATVAFDAASGAQLWEARFEAAGAGNIQVGTTVAVSPDGAVVVSGGYSSVLALLGVVLVNDAATGDELWSKTLVEGSSGPVTDLAVGDGAIYLIRGGRVVALDLADGSELWSRGAGDPVDLVLEADLTTLFVASSAADNLVVDALDVTDGQLLWTASYDGGIGVDAGWRVALDAPGHRVFVAGYSEGPDPGTSAVPTSHDDAVVAAYRVPSLVGKPGVISAAVGGTQTLFLRADPELAGGLFALAGSLSGTEPGFPLGAVLVPLNPDAYFFVSLGPSSPVVGGVGLLDGVAQAEAALVLPPGATSTLVGTTVAHAYGVADPLLGTVLFASNAALLEFFP